MNIGLLEDNPAILDYLSIALRLAGHHVYSYPESTPLLETLQRAVTSPQPLPFDLLIIDLLLPGPISGLETIRRVQQSIAFERLPIIIISAISQDELEQVKINLPHIPLLRKPFKMHTLLQLLQELKGPRGRTQPERLQDEHSPNRPAQNGWV